MVEFDGTVEGRYYFRLFGDSWLKSRYFDGQSWWPQSILDATDDAETLVGL